jgi:hypothetical protein
VSGLSRYLVEIRDEFADADYRAVLWARSPEAAVARFVSSIDCEQKINLSGHPTKVTRVGFPLAQAAIRFAKHFANPS